MSDWIVSHTRGGVTLALVFVALLVPSHGSAQGQAAHYWNRPYAEFRILQNQIKGVAPIIDARCTGSGVPRFTPRGEKRFSVFDCKVLTNVGGANPWVVVGIYPTGTRAFRVHVD